MSELLEFLLARVAEDKAVIRRLLDYFEGSPLYADGMDDMAKLRAVQDDTGVGWGGDYVDISISPARFLAECEAKRRIVELHSPDPYYGGCELDGVHRPPHDGDPVDVDPYPCETLRLLALPYSNHPDYREEWKP